VERLCSPVWTLTERIVVRVGRGTPNLEPGTFNLELPDSAQPRG